jgi:hypothetical protein
VTFRVWPVRIAVVIFFNPHDHRDAVRVLLIGSLLRRCGTLGSE